MEHTRDHSLASAPGARAAKPGAFWSSVDTVAILLFAVYVIASNLDITCLDRLARGLSLVHFAMIGMATARLRPLLSAQVLKRFTERQHYVLCACVGAALLAPRGFLENFIFLQISMCHFWAGYHFVNFIRQFL